MVLHYLCRASMNGFKSGFPICLFGETSERLTFRDNLWVQGINPKSCLVLHFYVGSRSGKLQLTFNVKSLKPVILDRLLVQFIRQVRIISSKSMSAMDSTWFIEVP